MFTPRRLILAAVGLLCGCGDGAKLTLRYHPPAGATYSYDLEQHFDIKAKGGAVPDQEMAIHVHFTQLVGGPTDGGIRVSLRLDSTSVDSRLMAANAYRPAFDRMRGLTNNLVYDDRMNVVHAELANVGGVPSPLAEQIGKQLKEATFPLPDRPVGVGDTWTVQVEVPLEQGGGGANPMKATTTLKVKKISVDGPDTTVLMSLKTTFPRDPIKIMQEGKVLTLRMSGNVNGEQLFSLSRGAVVRSSRNGTVRIDMEGATKGDNMNLTTRQGTSLELREAN